MKKTLIIAMTLLTIQAAEAQLLMNPSNQHYECRMEISQGTELALKGRLNELNFELKDQDDLDGSGSFTHLISGHTPMEITYRIVERDGYLVCTDFTLTGGPTQARTSLESIPAKHQKKWIRIINEEMNELKGLL